METVKATDMKVSSTGPTELSGVDKNELIKKLNDGVVDMAYRVNWPHYRNSILLTQHNELKQLNTKVFKIIEL